MELMTYSTEVVFSNNCVVLFSDGSYKLSIRGSYSYPIKGAGESRLLNAHILRIINEAEEMGIKVQEKPLPVWERQKECVLVDLSPEEIRRKINDALERLEYRKDLYSGKKVKDWDYPHGEYCQCGCGPSPIYGAEDEYADGWHLPSDALPDGWITPSGVIRVQTADLRFYWTTHFRGSQGSGPYLEKEDLVRFNVPEEWHDLCREAEAKITRLRKESREKREPERKAFVLRELKYAGIPFSE